VSEQVYGPIIGVLVSALFVWQLVSGFNHGEMQWPSEGFSL